VTVSNGATCTDDTTIHINVNPLPTVTAYSDTTIDMGASVQLYATGALSYTWYPPNDLTCNNCPDPVANPLVTTIYYVTGVDVNGCSNTDTVIVSVKMDCGEVFVPSAFSPNGDGINDVLYVSGNCIKYMEFSIYDRWGEKVFYGNDPIVGWNGKYHEKLMNTDVFVYFLRAYLYNGDEVKKQGNITLFR
jgi:gliding motility-associated-like protein